MMEDSKPQLTPNGGCIKYATKNTKKWYDIFSKYYYEATPEEEDSDRSCSWNGTTKQTTIKYSERSTDFSIAINVYNTTGTICIQGSSSCLQKWMNEH